MTTSRTAQPEPPGSLLPLPNPAGLANTQRCGRSCLWCGVLLPLAAAVDLGQRRARDGTAWFPRACHTCTKVRVNEALTAHRAFCQACIEVDDPCTTRDDLQALVGAQ